MPRALLDIWRALNRERKPSSLLEKLTADIKREMESPAGRRRQMINRLAPKPLTPIQHMNATIERQYTQMSPIQRAMAELARKESVVAGRILGTPRPVQPRPPQRKRKPGAGRRRALTQEQIEEGIRILREQPRMTVEAARSTLRAAGIEAKDTALYELVIRPAYGRRPA